MEQGDGWLVGAAQQIMHEICEKRQIIIVYVNEF
jgi:hypothetical protein